MSPSFSTNRDAVIALHVIDQQELKNWLNGQDDLIRNWVKTNGFTAERNQALVIPAADGGPRMALAGYGTAGQRTRRHFLLAAAAAKLPAGVYEIASGLRDEVAETECFGWLMSTYRFDRYRSHSVPLVELVAPDNIDANRVEIMAAAEVLIRDLINTPASDLGPDTLELATTQLATEHGAEVSVIRGDDLLTRNLPLIHTVGRAADRAPRLIDLRWGNTGPTLTLVGKGVCFDTGGLNLKPRTSMATMKKDMGGAATTLGLAQMIMALNLPVQLRVLIPAVENSVAGNAYRPGDILTSRKGLTVEINNTDAEGRLVLADALTVAAEEKPDLIVSMATLTGAARTALGSDIAPFFTNDDAAANALGLAAARVDDPVWRLPFHEPYELKIEPANADLDNAPAGGFAGAITAALFLRRFVDHCRYVHFDIYAWQSAKAPSRPKGGLGQGARAFLAAMPEILKL